MPSRFCFFGSDEEVKKRYGISEINFDFWENYNIKPTNKVIGIVQNGENQVVKLRWGFVGGNQFFKARAETVDEKRLFGKAFKERRCLILANGFFEWDKSGSQSIPYYFKLKSHDIFSIAGLYNSYEDDDGETQYRFAVITVPPNKVVEPIFHRMPAMFYSDKEKIWLDPTSEPEYLKSILEPYKSKEMETYEVESLPSRGDNGPDTIKPKPEEADLDDFF